MARLLRSAVRYGGNKNPLLSAAGSGDLRVVGPACAARLRLCGEGEPLSHAHEEAEGSRRSGSAVLHAREAARTRVRSGALSTAAAVAGQRGAARNIPESAAADAAPHDRIPGAELVLRRGVRAARTPQGVAVPARHGRLRIGQACD